MAKVEKGKWTRTEEIKRKRVEEEEESMLRKTVQYKMALERAEAMKESEETQEVVELAEMEVNEEEVEWRAEGQTQFEADGGDLNPVQVRQGREEEMKYTVKTLGMFEIGSWEEATSYAGKAPTTTKWIDRARKNDDGREFVRCRLVARDFRPRREGPRDDLFAAMPPLEAKNALFAYFALAREKRREQGQQEVTLMFIDVTKAHFSAKCGGRLEWVELLDEFKMFGKCSTLKRWLYGVRKAASGWDDDCAMRLVNDGFQRGRAVMCVSPCRATTSRSQPRIRSWERCERGCANGTTSRCVAFCDVREIEIFGKKLEADRGRAGWSTKRVTNIARHCWKGWD